MGVEDWREVLIKMKDKRKSHVENYNLVIQFKIETEKETRKSYPVRLDHVTPSNNRVISPQCLAWDTNTGAVIQRGPRSPQGMLLSALLAVH